MKTKMISTNPVAGGPQGNTLGGGMHYTEGAPTGANSQPTGVGLNDTAAAVPALMGAVPGYSYGAEHSGDTGGA